MTNVGAALPRHALEEKLYKEYLPDYIGGGLNAVRPYFGTMWFQSNWGYEESKHSLVLMEYLMRSKKRTPEQMFDLQQKTFAKRWTTPFQSCRQMTIYGCFQEMATFFIYCRQREVAKERENDHCLWQIYDFIGRDEIAHTRFYQGVVKVLLGEDRDGTIKDIAHVAKNFRMPGEDLIEDYDSRINVMREMGDIDRNMFLQKVYFPVLKQLGVTRAELVRVSRAARAEPETAVA
ncbi:MAG: acyl-ACP desaturase [Deltaproteobacteria bacterium]|nr:acyl-ACP desaturase [Deltaproteobacteria bacterium]